ncbi:MAG: hypothetical protein JWQ16_2512 [Novosphingobium sp.]|nr:hypothetical protein [Novosphingobium sp.]
MDDILQELVDHHQIRKLLSQYSRGCDRCDQPVMASIYADESWDDHGNRSARGADFAKLITDEMVHIDSLSHLLGQSTISVDGDTAGAETYFLATMRVADEAAGEMLNQLGGRFLDRLQRTPEGWKVTLRTAVRDWSITLPVQADYIGQQGLAAGARGVDPSYATLGEIHSGLPGFAAVS